MNTLAQRLKFAKRELTALKTAHRRGLGLMKVYKTIHYFEDDDISYGYEYNGVLTLNFSAGSSPYPYFNVLAASEELSEYYIEAKTIDIASVRYTNSGHSAEVSGRIFYGYGDIYDKIIIYSAAPIISTSGTWSLA